MARMIPAAIDPDTSSRGEIELFNALSKDKRTGDWIVLHSLDIADHASHETGEIDFVIIIPDRGVLCLEVKGVSRFVCRNGRWKYGSKKVWISRSPFAQAKEARFSLIHWLEKSPAREMAKFFMWHAVIFPFAPFKQKKSPEWHPWEVIDKDMYEGRPLHSLFSDLLKKAWDHFKKTRKDERVVLPGPEHCEAIANALRPKFEFHMNPAEEALSAERDIKNFTEEQFKALDALEYNPRILFAGPAGTGKTLLALEAARRAGANEIKTLLLCKSNNLGDWLEKQSETLEPWVVAGSIFKLMKEVCGPDFDGKDLVKTSLKKLKNRRKENPPFDLLVVDEAQDITENEDWLEFINFNLTGGLKKGKWLMFSDTFARDFGRPSDFALLDAYGSGYTKYALKTNCRNSHEIAKFAARLSGEEKGYDEIKRADGGHRPEMFFYNEGNQADILSGQLTKFLESGYSPSDIAVLSTVSRKNSIAQKLSQDEQWSSLLVPFSTERRNVIGFCSVWDLKGLEKNVIIIANINRTVDPDMRNLLYIGSSRALQRLSLLIDEKFEDEYKLFL